MNTLFVHLLQLVMVLLITVYTLEKPNFGKVAPKETLLLMARFAATMFMHIAVEKDVNNGLQMMKYAVNHRENFVNCLPPFLLGYCLF